VKNSNVNLITVFQQFSTIVENDVIHENSSDPLVQGKNLSHCGGLFCLLVSIAERYSGHLLRSRLVTHHANLKLHYLERIGEEL
jgi:hypothetical protein